MSTTTDDTATIKPWTIKGVPPEERNAAIYAAGRNNMNMGEWIARAIRTQVQLDREAQRSPARVDAVAPAPAQPASPPVDFTEISRIACLVRLACECSKDGKPPRSVSRLVNKMIRDRLTGA
jgi:hypothetical protein